MRFWRRASRPKKKFIIPRELYSLLEHELELSEKEWGERVMLIQGEIRKHGYHVTDVIPFEKLRSSGVIMTRINTKERMSVRIRTLSLQKFIISLSSPCIFWAHTHLMNLGEPVTPSLDDLEMCQILGGIPGLILTHAYTSPRIKKFEIVAYNVPEGFIPLEVVVI